MLLQLLTVALQQQRSLSLSFVMQLAAAGAYFTRRSSSSRCGASRVALPILQLYTLSHVPAAAAGHALVVWHGCSSLRQSSCSACCCCCFVCWRWFHVYMLYSKPLAACSHHAGPAQAEGTRHVLLVVLSLGIIQHCWHANAQTLDQGAGEVVYLMPLVCVLGE